MELKNWWDSEGLFEGLFLEDNPPAASQGAVVVACGMTQPCLPARRAAELYRTDCASHVVMTGAANTNGGCPEGEAMAAVACGMGVPFERMLVDTTATNTRENAKRAWELVVGAGLAPRRVLIVCAPWHARRALMTFAAVLPRGATVYALPYPYRGITRENWDQTPEGRQAVNGEMTRIGIYLAKGDIVKIRPAAKGGGWQAVPTNAVTLASQSRGVVPTGRR